MKDWRVAFLGTPLYPSMHQDEGLERTISALGATFEAGHPETWFSAHMVRRDAATGEMRRVDLRRDDDRAHLRCLWKRHLRRLGVPPAVVNLFTVPVSRPGSR